MVVEGNGRWLDHRAEAEKSSSTPLLWCWETPSPLKSTRASKVGGNCMQLAGCLPWCFHTTGVWIKGHERFCFDSFIKTKWKFLSVNLGNFFSCCHQKHVDLFHHSASLPTRFNQSSSSGWFLFWLRLQTWWERSSTHHTSQYFTMCHAVPDSVTLGHFVSHCYIVSLSVTLCHTVPQCVTLCHIM